MYMHRGAHVYREVQGSALFLEGCRVSTSASKMRVPGLEAKPWGKTWPSQRVFESLEHACLPRLWLPLSNCWLPHCIATGPVSRLKAGGGGLNAGGVAAASPFCSPTVQKRRSSQGLRCGA